MGICAVLGIAFALTVPSGWQEERLDDTEYDKYVAVHVKAVEAIEKAWRKDPAAGLKSIEPVLKGIEADLLPRYPRLAESTIAVRATRGIDKGAIKERHAFLPYRLAGEIALAAGEPERAAELFRKSPSSAALLEKALQVAAIKKTANEKTEPVVPLKPPVDLGAFVQRLDFIGALEAIRTHREALGPNADGYVEDLRREAIRHQQAAVSALAGLLPRIDQAAFRTDHLEPCLKSCARVPVEFETDALRWVRRLDRWIEKRDPAEFERLALAGAGLGADFTVLCDRAQEQRLGEMERQIDSIVRAERADRTKLLDQLGQTERAFDALAAAHERPELRERCAALKARIPIDDQVLELARAGVSSIPDIRRLADELDRLWISDRRTRLSLPDQKELAIHLGAYRCLSLFLDGRTIEEAARDVRVVEVFRLQGELPRDLSPKVAAVRARVRGK